MSVEEKILEEFEKLVREILRPDLEKIKGEVEITVNYDGGCVEYTNKHENVEKIEASIIVIVKRKERDV